MRIERSLRKIQEVVRRKNIFWYISDKENPEDWHPHPETVAFNVGSGLVFYEPREDEHGNVLCAEMFAALDEGDMPSNPSEQVRKQWDYLKTLGIITVYAQVEPDHDRSRLMCRAVGMDKRASEDDYHIYEKVI